MKIGSCHANGPVTVVAMVVACLIGSGELVCGESNQLSTFEDVVFTGSDGAEKAVGMKTLWEVNMADVDGGNAAMDAYENNHNLMLIDGVVYAYVEQYNNASTSTICLRKFDALTGEELGTVYSSYPSEHSNMQLYCNMLMQDDAHHIVAVGIYKNYPRDKALSVNVEAFDKDLNRVRSYSYTSPGYSDIDHIRHQIEWLGCSGDVAAGNFDFSIGCWHSFISAGATGSDVTFYPSVCRFSYSSSSPDCPQVDVVRYDSGESYSFENRYEVAPLAAQTEGLLFVKRLSATVELVQGFGTLSSPAEHSPLLLYNNNGATDTRWAHGEYPLMEQQGALTDNNLAGQDKYCFGAYPVELGNEMLLLLPYRFNSADGVRFKLARFTQSYSLSSLQELWSFPNKVSYPYPVKIYDMVRPRVVVEPLSSTDDCASANIYAYMPGCYLGAYEVELGDDSFSSVKAVAEDSARVAIVLSDRVLQIESGLGNLGGDRVELFDLTGARVYSLELGEGSINRIDLSGLNRGVYLCKVASSVAKICLR